MIGELIISVERRTLIAAALFLAGCATGEAAPDLITAAPGHAPPTSTARPAPTLFPSLTPPPLANRTPIPTATPSPTLRRLTSNGCCVGPSFSPDGSEIWFIDRPDAASPAGLWGLPAAGGSPQFITDRLGLFSADGSLVAYPEGGRTMVERRATGERWPVPADGRAILFDLDASHIAWQVASSSLNFDSRLVEFWVANVDGSEARSVGALIGGGLSSWSADGARLFVTGRETLGGEPMLASLNVFDASLTPVVRGVLPRGTLVSPGGGWIAYQVAFTGRVADDGLWLARSDGSDARKLNLFGAFRWRVEGRLLVVPLETNLTSHRLIEVDAPTGALTPRTDPKAQPFRIAGGDWSVSPDGTRIVFVSDADHNLWLIDLPP